MRTSGGESGFISIISIQDGRSAGAKMPRGGQVIFRLVLIIAGLGSAGLSRSTAQAAQGFDTASIRRSLPSAAVVDNLDPLHLAIHNRSLLGLIEIAYGLNSDQVEAPRWMAQEDYSVDAETQHPASRAQMEGMLKRFLIRQFGLVTHRAARMESVYALEIAPSGFHLKPEPEDEPGLRRAELRSHRDGGSVLLEVRSRCDLDFFANALRPLVDRPVVNDTGIHGIYSFDLTFAPGPEAPQPAPEADSARAAATVPGPSLFAALSEQLGLKLVARKQPIAVLVIDHAAQHPLGN